MRSWTMAVACAWMVGCVVYKDDGSSWHSSSGSTWTTPPPREGQLEVSWQLGSAGCEAAGIESVEVEVGRSVTVFPCADEAATLSVEVGRYPLTLRGTDVDGVARYQGDGGEVRVRAGELTSVPTIVMSALPVTIEASWFFDNGRLCSQNGVVDMEVSLFNADDVLKASEMVACDLGAIAFEEMEPDTYALLLLGRGSGGEVLYSGQSQLDAERGDSLALEIVLVPED